MTEPCTLNRLESAVLRCLPQYWENLTQYMPGLLAEPSDVDAAITRLMGCGYVAQGDDNVLRRVPGTGPTVLLWEDTARRAGQPGSADPLTVWELMQDDLGYEPLVVPAVSLLVEGRVRRQVDTAGSLNDGQVVWSQRGDRFVADVGSGSVSRTIGEFLSDADAVNAIEAALVGAREAFAAELEGLPGPAALLGAAVRAMPSHIRR